MVLKCFTRKRKDGTNYVACAKNPKKAKKKRKKPVGDVMKRARAIAKESREEAKEKAKTKKVTFAPNTKTKDGGKKQKMTKFGKEVAQVRRTEQGERRTREVKYRAKKRLPIPAYISNRERERQRAERGQ